MSWEKKLSIFLVILAGAVFLTLRLSDVHRRAKQNELRDIAVTIEGIVRKPGTYHVPFGTTKFELLQVAGVLPNSDLSNVDVYAQAESGEKITVGKLEQDFAVKPDDVARSCRINYSVGDVIVRSAKGTRKAVKGDRVEQGETIISGKNGMMEIMLGDESLVDIRENSELLVESLYASGSDGQLLVHFSILKGRLWSFIKPQPSNIKWSFLTPVLAAYVHGTEIEIEHIGDRSVLLVKKGLMYAGRRDSEKRYSVMEGQKIEIASDLNVDVAVVEQSEEDKVESERIAAASSGNESSSSVKRFIVLLIPQYYVLVEIDSQKATTTLSRIMPTTNVSEFVEGVSELGKVYLYGGIRLTVSVIERMSRKRIERFMVFERESVKKAIDIIDGVAVNLDNEAAGKLGLRSGPQRLSSEQVEQYVRYERAMQGRSFEAEDKLLKSIFDEIIQNKLAVTQLLITQLTGGIETDFDPSYGMSLFNTVRSRTNWSFDIVAY